jgi:hypothetical protein
MYDMNKLNQIILDNLPHWAMLINVKTRTVLAANKLAYDGGAKIDCQCWDDFGHRQFISEEHKELIEKDPERKRDNIIKCDYCLADEAMESGKPEHKEVEIEGTFWDTWWVPVDKEIYLHYAMDITVAKQLEQEREHLIADLQDALSKVRTLSGLLPICASCKKIRDDRGYWNQIESYIRKHSKAEFSHGICPECAKKLYPDLDIHQG